MNRLNPLRTAFVAGMIILRTCGAGGKTPPLRDPASVQNEETIAPAQKNERSAIEQQSIIDRPGASNLVTVAQLTEIVANVKGKDDSETAKEIEHLQLTERLSSSKLSLWSTELRKESRSALTAIGDLSAFLDPPANEIPNEPVPGMAERTHILSMALDYLKRIIPKLPDFYAKRYTTSFKEVWKPKDEAHMGKRIALHSAGKSEATVYYRGGKEIVHEEGSHERGLITRGTFGPILSVVVLDAAHSKTMQWSRWEVGPNGSMAVFRFRVPQTESHYEVAGTLEFGMMGPTAYRGEIGIDPTSGTILRLMVEADPELGSTIERAGIMVEYGPVEIGGKTYTCPVRSVSYSVSALDVLMTANRGRGTKRKAARLNDVNFSDYHVFRSQMRILPD